MKHTPLYALFAVSIFLSAALLFMVQPMVGKMMLPLVGGAPSGWIVALAFFQTSLLAGYFLAHQLSRFTPRYHGVALCLLLLGGVVFLPLQMDLSESLSNSTNAAYTVFMLLLTAVFVPFTALSTVSSTVQRLFHNTDAMQGQDPYVLYAVGNFGSLIGLLSYPFIIEPSFSIPEQTMGWGVFYGALILLLAVASFMTRSSKSSDLTRKTAEKTAPLTILQWVGLSFVGSGLLVSVTNYITMDIASIPMFWVLPLAIYLLTFIYAFSTIGQKRYKLLTYAQPVAVAAIVFYCSFVSVGGGAIIMILHAIMFAIVTTFCHVRLAKLKPHASELTSFYMYLSLGGALGGLFNAFVAPHIFVMIFEYPAIAILSLLLNPMLRTKFDEPNKIITTVGCGIMILFSISLSMSGFDELTDKSASNTGAVIVLVSIFALLINHPKFVLPAAIFAFGLMINKTNSIDLEYKDRNFFGTIIVFNATTEYEDESYDIRYLKHGSTIHGTQVLSGDLRLSGLTSYYRPLADIFGSKHIETKSVGGIGLGAGVILCNTAPDRHFTMFEIDADILKVAREHFEYIKDCAHPDNSFIIGDGRIEFEKHDQAYDLIVLDAFSSDSIPTHTLTKEAFEIYADRLNENGAIAINISNRHFYLGDIIARISSDLGFETVIKVELADKEFKPWEYPYLWVTLTKHAPFANDLRSKGWHDLSHKDDTPLWTDDYTFLLSQLNWFHYNTLKALDGADAETEKATTDEK